MRDTDWSSIPFDDLPPWHLDWDVDQRIITPPPTTANYHDRAKFERNGP
ncbi:TPA: hypothetical protein ACJINU_002174 [Escherichia coli]